MTSIGTLKRPRKADGDPSICGDHCLAFSFLPCSHGWELGEKGDKMMTGAVNQQLLIAALVGGVVGAILLLTPVGGTAAYANAHDGWIDQLTGFVLVKQGIAKANGEVGRFDPYLGQLDSVRSLFGRRDLDGTYDAMNVLMDMLEAREGGISAEAAEAIWDFCYRVTPRALHDLRRHEMWWDKTVDWDSFFWRE